MFDSKCLFVTSKTQKSNKKGHSFFKNKRFIIKKRKFGIILYKSNNHYKWYNNRQCSNSKVQKKIKKKEQSAHRPLKKIEV